MNLGSKQIGSSLFSSVQQSDFFFFNAISLPFSLWCSMWAAWIFCQGSAGSWIRCHWTLHHCWVLCTHVLIILELLGYFADRDAMKWCFSSFSLFSPFLSPWFWIPLVNWICREGRSQCSVSDECRQLHADTGMPLHSVTLKCQDLDQKNPFSWLILMFPFKIWHVKLQLLFLKVL